MSQGYHTNAKTNMHSREIIQQSDLTDIELAERFEINEKTVSKWSEGADISKSKNINSNYLSNISKETIKRCRYVKLGGACSLLLRFKRV